MILIQVIKNKRKGQQWIIRMQYELNPREKKTLIFFVENKKSNVKTQYVFVK